MECSKGALLLLVQYDSGVMSWLHPSELHVKYQLLIVTLQRGELATDGEGKVVHKHIC